MKTVLTIITVIIIAYTRKRLLDQAFSQQKIKFSITLKITINAVFLVGMLFLYQFAIQKIGSGNFYFANELSLINIGIFIGYCTAILLILTAIHKNLNKKNIIRIITNGTIFFTILGGLSLIIPINTLIIYFIIAAYAEEYLKFTTGNNLNPDQKPKSNDLLFFCLLIGLGFSGIENTLYAGNNLLEILKGGASQTLLFGRGLSSTIIHLVSTGTIGLITIFFQKHKIKSQINKLINIPIAFLGGVFIHSIYNISLNTGNKILIISVIILAYFLLSYILFNADLIFKQSKE